MDINENKTEGSDSMKKKSGFQKEKRFIKFLDTKLLALFVLGVLIGLTVKTQASKTITMGFDDYKIEKAEKQELNVSDLKQKEKQTEEAEEDAEEMLLENGQQELEEVEVPEEGAENNQNEQEIE